MKRRDEVLVGIFTTAAIAVIIVGALWLARGGLTSGYPLYSRFPWGSGLKQGQRVWLAGVTAGRDAGCTVGVEPWNAAAASPESPTNSTLPTATFHVRRRRASRAVAGSGGKVSTRGAKVSVTAGTVWPSQ